MAVKKGDVWVPRFKTLGGAIGWGMVLSAMKPKPVDDGAKALKLIARKVNNAVVWLGDPWNTILVAMYSESKKERDSAARSLAARIAEVAHGEISVANEIVRAFVKGVGKHMVTPGGMDVTSAKMADEVIRIKLDAHLRLRKKLVGLGLAGDDTPPI